ncbi:hypothetical protein BsIDN1_36850 [Bacillus safensis]|uniref:Uncharacterized protein n=1 Tax=Bacillus safensis TaxID=561879 RepID=A0A5S9M986_BACIA|nr:hypothetical protein BsIDN1_36850 [Bacillus safensis]
MQLVQAQKQVQIRPLRSIKKVQNASLIQRKENIQHFVMLSAYNADDPNQGKGQGSMETYYEAKKKKPMST